MIHDSLRAFSVYVKESAGALCASRFKVSWDVRRTYGRSGLHVLLISGVEWFAHRSRSSGIDADAGEMPVDMHVVAIVGNSDSGKTTVASSIIHSLTAEGYRIAAIKHCPQGHDVDRADSDTDRLRRAGAVTVVASSPGRLTTMEEVTGEPSLESLVYSVGCGADLVVAEGFTANAVPKVLVMDGNSPPPAADNVIAVVADTPQGSKVPTYGFDELHMLATQIRSRFLDQRSDATPVSLIMDGNPVRLKSFPTSVLSGIIKGFLSSLNGVPSEPSTIQVAANTGRRKRPGRRPGSRC